MDVHRHPGRPLYVSPSPETHAYQHLYGTVRGNPMGKMRPTLNMDPPPPSGKPKKQFNFLPWKKNKNKAADDLVVNGNLSRHNKFKFGSVSALSSGGLYRDYDSTLTKTPSYSASDLKHASIKSVGGRSRGTVTYPWETYKSNNSVEVMNYKNVHLSDNPAGVSSTVLDDRLSSNSVAPCKCQTQRKKSGPFGTLTLSSLKTTKCSCGFSSVRSSRGFAPPPPPRRRSILPEKVDLYAVHEDLDPQFVTTKQQNIYDTLSRHSKYRAPEPPVINYGTAPSKMAPSVISYDAATSKLAKTLEKCRKDPFSSVASRKSILECDVTAYDLVKSYLKTNSRVDSDLDDDLSDNAIEEEKKIARDHPKQDMLLVQDKSGKRIMENSPSPVSSESESGIYSQASSVRIGGHGMKIFQPIDHNGGSQTSSLYSEGSKTNSVDSRTSSWSNSSLSDDGIYSLPEPDYHDEDPTIEDEPILRRYDNAIYSTGSTLNLSRKLGISTKDEDHRYFNQSESPRFATNTSETPRFATNTPEPPRFSTIRKATSMVSLASGICQNGTLRGRGKVPEPPIVATPPQTSSIPPPPPPPPPPANYTVPRQPPSEEPKKVLPEERKRVVSNDMSSSIASELAEKLKSNQPLLKKNEVKPKQPMKVNSHNPYAEVKSILKKTGESLALTSGSDKSSPMNSKLLANMQDDTKKKKRVQFKSLSNESLAVEHISLQTLSSSDEEWEEARDSFEEPDKSSSKIQVEQKDQVQEEFQTAEKFLAKREPLSNPSLPKVQSKAAPTMVKGQGKVDQAFRSEYKVPTKPSSISRPTHPPPPPPQNRNRAPAPRPLSTAPKSYSHCDLRVNRPNQLRTPGLAKIAVRQPARFGPQTTGSLVQAKARLKPTVGTSVAANDPARSVQPRQDPNSIIPKNVLPSPAASPEDTTSPRGKPQTDLGNPSPTSNSIAEPHDDLKPRVSNMRLLHSIGDPVDHYLLEQSTDGSTSESFLERSTDGGIDEGPQQQFINDSSDEYSQQHSIDVRKIATSVGHILPEDGSTAFYVARESTEVPVEEEMKSGEQKVIERCDRYKLNPSSITCTVVSAPAMPVLQSNVLIPVFNSNSSSAEHTNYGSSKDRKFQETKDSNSNSDEEEGSIPVIEGPLYSNLLYVQRKSPSPPPLPTSLPPLPCSLPPLPPKRDPNTVLTTIPTYITRWSLQAPDDPYEDPIYDTIPAPKRLDVEQSIYESRRYSDTGATIITISAGSTEVDGADHIYSSLGSESIYEELPGLCKDSAENLAVLNPFGQHRRSFFEGASKAEILKFLEVAKERVVRHLVEDDMFDDDDDDIPQTKTLRNIPIRISNISSSSDTSTISSNSSKSSRECSSSDDQASIKSGLQNGTIDVERSDSGVGTETSKPIVLRRLRSEAEEVCADCEQQLEATEGGPAGDSSCCPLVCKKCDKKRCERKEIVTEIVETEFKYGKDLVVIKEEFKNPMEVAGLLSKDQLSGVFLNLCELIVVNSEFSEKLKDAVDIATEQGDEEYTTVNIGKLFLETTSMLRAFEVYCIRQGAASVLLTNLEKEKELLRIFLRVSQMENPLLRRMNLSAFLMVPVQRVTKYPLLLNRLYKVTPYHHKDREALREAQLKIELHLEHINQQTKGITGTKIWRRISNISTTHRRIVNVSDIGSIHLRKMALEVLEWSKEDIRFVMAGKLAFSGTIDFTKSRRGRAVKFTPSHAILATLGKPNSNYRPDLAQEDSVLFPKNTGIEDATLLLMKEKNGRYSLAREPLHLGSCVISAELEDEDIIEIQEYTTKESVFLKSECRSDTSEWLKQLRYHAKDLGTWKRRRNALANIMINGMSRQQ